MPTANVYIDGFNLYYRCLKDTPYKWLNVSRLAALLLPAGTQVNRIRYFTARMRALPNDPDAPTRQQIFLRALATIPNLSITYGHFLSNNVTMPLVNPSPTGPKFAQVIRTDEKGSDVNLATYLLLDAFKHEAEIALIISNDSDLAEPIRVVKTEFGVTIGITQPCRGRPSVTLGGLADFVKQIRAGALMASQFPKALTDATGTFEKPPTW